ncbi:sugar ABC transporter permease [Streptomyces alkaliterrae]|uniref:Xylose transport system permease protein XylH n=1 Tax=Streptomyces alkaliterrae TaxID=2213162 RepID=A0A5P0YN53_9ACTN|nr:sugar ABC transporter permease [Streptomyces alkaliterrae]MBB1254675.1 sugar ABC transporter permease [Streptomyces alkaliterrae]MBB1261129.1 sugar ABC transporter permease [Streptomyces alkaliterrae]MQS01350.1 sugar ABC transporter permease [Streptomyces alkaliterrae]
MSTELSKSPDGGDSTPTPEAATSAPAAGAITAVDPRLLVREQGFKGYVTDFVRRMRSGELGSVPVVVGLIVIWAIFQSLDGAFLSAQNLSNLSVYIVGTGLISVGIVFVLLLGEIDLSVGSVSGLAGAVFAVLAVNNGMAEWLALLLALATGAAAGAVHGFFFARIGVPAFVVTLAGLLAWNGLMLQVLDRTGTINLDDEGLVATLTSHYFSDVSAAYGLAAVAVLIFGGAQLLDARRRQAAGVPFRPLVEIALRTGVLALFAFAAAHTLNQYRGLPLALLVFLVVLVLFDLLLRRTGYGRKVFALGGSTEAARRAGINVAAIRISVFSLAGTMAAFGGLMIASRISAANQGAGSGNLLMEAIAAAVIGGTSLFGGRGNVWSALLGMLVIGSIANGLALLGSPAHLQYMITGGVLLAAVVIDSVSRRTQKSAGRT